MKSKEIVEHMISTIISRREVLNLAFDRGLGKGMHIENWILAEMLPKLIELKDKGYVDEVEGEHGYPCPKRMSSNRKEEGDFWWRINQNQHWLEVKTIILSKNKKIGEINKEFKEVIVDLDKMNRLRDPFVFYHLTIAFIEEPVKINDWRNRLHCIYEEKGLEYETEWKYTIEGEKKLFIVLFARVEK